MQNHISDNVTTGQTHDPHHAFSRLVVDFPWLLKVEARARNAQIETFQQLHASLTWVHFVCWERLPHHHAVVADLFLGRLLDDAADFWWRVTTS